MVEVGRGLGLKMLGFPITNIELALKKKIFVKENARSKCPNLSIFMP